MNILAELRRRFATALEPLVDDPAEALDSIRKSTNPQFGDYQADCAMRLGNRLKRPPREIAAEVVGRLDVADLCEDPEVAGPGFINLRLRDDWLAAQVASAVADLQRLSVAPAAEPMTCVLDYSAPNVAKPMHVGHIRSTVIGDALYRTLKFLGHRVIGDNHVGDWGTQFGMIIYGYKHFRDEEAYRQNPVDELSRLYRVVNQLVEYHALADKLPELEKRVAAAETALSEHQETEPPAGDSKEDKKAAKKHASRTRSLDRALDEARKDLEAARQKRARVENSPELSALAREHPDIGRRVLAETARLHAGDEENRRLWREFLPPCMEAIDAVYRRLGVSFDETLGESFYQDRLAGVVEDLRARGIARPGEGGAVCVFDEGWPSPMIVQKGDGAFLYATTDLATIQYRAERWSPDTILYVVDHRQSLHFQQLFETARRWNHADIDFRHVSFGTVLGEDRRPFKTRSGDTVGLWGLLDEAVRRALEVVSTKDDDKTDGPELATEERQRIAEIVGIGALKYQDLVQNRTSDYVFSYDKMLALDGNTATYMQYAYARTQSIFRRGEVDVEALRASAPPVLLGSDAERSLALRLLAFSEALDGVLIDYRPNLLTNYLWELSNDYSTFFDKCPVLKAETPELRASRLLLNDLTGRTIAKGLDLLGIDVVEKM